MWCNATPLCCDSSCKHSGRGTVKEKHFVVEVEGQHRPASTRTAMHEA
jgi:hypothetical protein